MVPCTVLQKRLSNAQ